MKAYPRTPKNLGYAKSMQLICKPERLRVINQPKHETGLDKKEEGRRGHPGGFTGFSGPKT